MNYKTFFPARLKKDRDIDEDAVEAAYEDLSQTEDRLNSWMTFSGKRLQVWLTALFKAKIYGIFILIRAAFPMFNTWDIKPLQTQFVLFDCNYAWLSMAYAQNYKAD